MRISTARLEDISKGETNYHGNPCKRCGCTLKRVKQQDCVDCHHKRNLKYNHTPSARAARKKGKVVHRATLKQAKVAWAAQDKITAIYEYARSLGYHVDHIVPLNSKVVCGFMSNTISLSSLLRTTLRSPIGLIHGHSNRPHARCNSW